MNEGSILAGLDVGTTKICAVVGQVSDGGLKVLALGTAPSRGLKKGIVVDVEATVESIAAAVKDAEALSGVEINSVYVGIAGGHIKSFESYGAVGIKGAEVSEVDLDRALESAKVVYVPLDREVLHVIPVEYVVDGQDGILNPLGMSGVRLEARVQIVTGSVSAVQNLVRCCEKAGLDVVDIVLEPLASALSSTTEEEKQQGVILVDIGGGTTDIAFFKNGVLLHSSVVAIGGNHITNDLAIGLRLPVAEAERVKKVYGSAVPDINDEHEVIQIMVAGRDEKTIPRSYATEIIQPRCEEIIEHVRNVLKDAGAYDEVTYGVVLTGGSSQLSGFDRLAEAMLGLPVRIGAPLSNNGMRSTLSDPMYSTGVGLLLYAMDAETPHFAYGDIFGNILKKMKGWVRGFLKRGPATRERW